MAKAILVPRWAVECIRNGLVLGQELREGESIKERIETILRTPAELNKWKRIVGCGIKAVRYLDENAADRWGGDLRGLLELDAARKIAYSMRLAFTWRYNDYVAVAYWENWARAGWSIVNECLTRSGELAESARERAAMLIAEAKTYWGIRPIQNKSLLVHWTGLEGWRNDDICQMCHCLEELLLPATDRKLHLDVIWMIFGGNMAYYRTEAERSLKEIAQGARCTVIRAQAEARVAKAESQAAAAVAELHRMHDEVDAAMAAQRQATSAQIRAEASQQQEAVARATAEALAAELKQRLKSTQQRFDAVLGLKQERDEALATPGKAAAQLYERLEKQLTPDERSLRDHLLSGGSQAAWGTARKQQGSPGSKGYVSKLTANIIRKYKDAGFQSPPFARCRGGRPPKVVVSVGTAKDAEGWGNTAKRTKKPKRGI